MLEQLLPLARRVQRGHELAARLLAQRHVLREAALLFDGQEGVEPARSVTLEPRTHGVCEVLLCEVESRRAWGGLRTG